MKDIFKNYLVTEFAEDYQEGHLTRRQALKLIAGVTGSLLLANSILAACAPPPQESVATTAPGVPTEPGHTPTFTQAPTSTVPPTETQNPTDTPPVTDINAGETPSAEATDGPYGTVSPDDSGVLASEVQFTGEDGSPLQGYLAQPAGAAVSPVVLVCHENRGLTAHIQDVTRRLAKAGYVALAVDLLSRQGGTAAVGSDNVPGVLGNSAPEQFVADFSSGWRYLGEQPFTESERVGMIGFCFGGGVTWLMATQMPELKAAVPFYGPHPPLEDVPNIQASVCAIYAGNDQRINQGIPAIEAAMQQNNKVFEKIIYPDVDHAFHNDTSTRYAPDAARDAWTRTLEWFRIYL